MGQIAQPISEERADDLYEAIFVGLGNGTKPIVEGCDHSLRHSFAWADMNGVHREVLKAWLHDNGGFCDCEVLYNVMPDEEEE